MRFAVARWYSGCRLAIIPPKFRAVKILEVRTLNQANYATGSWRRRIAILVLGVTLAAWVSSALAQEKPVEAKSSPQAIRQYRDAVAFQNRGVYDLAADEWSAFLTKFATDPLAGKAQHYLGVCLLQQQKLDEAIAAFDKAIKDFPASDITEQSYLNLGLAQYSAAQAGKAESFDQAAATFAALAEKYPKSPQLAQAVFYRAESLYARDKKAESVPLYARFVAEFKDSPLRPDALYALGVTQEELKQPAESGATFDLFLKEFEKHPLRAEVIMRRAEAFFAQQKYAEAEKWFASAAAAPDFKLADYALIRQAASLYEQKKYPEAAALYAQAATKYPQSAYVATAKLAAGNCYYLAGNLAEAVKWFDQAIESGGEGAVEATHWLAKCLLKENKPAEALAKVEQALANAGESPFKARLLLDKADALYELPDRRGDSVAVYAQVAKDFAQDAVASQAQYMAAFASLGLGQHQPALDYANAFIAAYPNDALLPDVLYVAAEANLLLGNHSEAEKLYGQLLEKHAARPDAQIWQVRLGLLQFLQKKYSEAVAQLTQALPNIKSPELQAEAQHLIGTSQLELQQADAAVKSLSAALAAAPKWRQADETLLNLAAAQRQLNQWQPAKESVAKVLAEFPQSKLLDRAHYRLADIAYAQGNSRVSNCVGKIRR
jgi:TolA-binding protein